MRNAWQGWSFFRYAAEYDVLPQAPPLRWLK